MRRVERAVCPVSSMTNNLAASAADIREMGREALDLVVSYYDSLASGRPVLRPTTSAALRE